MSLYLALERIAEPLVIEPWDVLPGNSRFQTLSIASSNKLQTNTQPSLVNVLYMRGYAQSRRVSMLHLFDVCKFYLGIQVRPSACMWVQSGVRTEA